jgi:hypothetical protein
MENGTAIAFSQIVLWSTTIGLVFLLLFLIMILFNWIRSKSKTLAGVIQFVVIAGILVWAIYVVFALFGTRPAQLNAAVAETVPDELAVNIPRIEVSAETIDKVIGWGQDIASRIQVRTVDLPDITQITLPDGPEPALPLVPIRIEEKLERVMVGQEVYTRVVTATTTLGAIADTDVVHGSYDGQVVTQTTQIIGGDELVVTSKVITVETNPGVPTVLTNTVATYLTEGGLVERVYTDTTNAAFLENVGEILVQQGLPFWIHDDAGTPVSIEDLRQFNTEAFRLKRLWEKPGMPPTTQVFSDTIDLARSNSTTMAVMRAETNDGILIPTFTRPANQDHYNAQLEEGWVAYYNLVSAFDGLTNSLGSSDYDAETVAIQLSNQRDELASKLDELERWATDMGLEYGDFGRLKINVDDLDVQIK